MKKDSLIMRVLGRIVNGKKTKDKKVIRPATKQEIEKSYFDAWEEYQYNKWVHWKNKMQSIMNFGLMVKVVRI